MLVRKRLHQASLDTVIRWRSTNCYIHMYWIVIGVRQSMRYAGPCQKSWQTSLCMALFACTKTRKYESCFRLQCVEWTRPQVGGSRRNIKSKTHPPGSFAVASVSPCSPLPMSMSPGARAVTTERSTDWSLRPPSRSSLARALSYPCRALGLMMAHWTPGSASRAQ